MKVDLVCKVPSWPLIERLVESRRLSYVDYALAETLLEGATTFNEDVALFIAYLSLASRHGHLCVEIYSGLNPDPVQLSMQSSLNSEFDNEISLPDEMQLIAQMIISGSSKIPEKLITHHPEKASFVVTPFCRLGNLFYFQRNWYFETLFIEHLHRLESRSPTLQLDEKLFSNRLKEAVKNKELLSEQAEAIEKSLARSLSIIHGGPGTGKTYSAARLIQIYWDSLSDEQKMNCEIALAAPTGKAAAHLIASITKALGNHPTLKLPQATTLHTLLSIHPTSQMKPKKIRADLILIDECSMIDVRMMSLLLSSIKDGARLILLGDGDQLPSVEGGSIFSDLIAYREATHSDRRLKSSQRSEQRLILDFSQAVHSGNENQASDILNNSSEREGLCRNTCDNQVNLVKTIANYYQTFSEDSFGKFCVLTPLRKGPFGVDTLNRLVFEEIIHRSDREKNLYVPIIITRNDPRYQLHNGDVGMLVRHAEGSNQKDYAIFPTKVAIGQIPIFLLPSYEYAYCLTVYKGQGSEYDHVLLLMPEGSEWFGREVLYTAATRAKKLLEIWGEDRVIRQTVVRKCKRLSGISYRIGKIAKR